MHVFELQIAVLIPNLQLHLGLADRTQRVYAENVDVCKADQWKTRTQTNTEYCVDREYWTC